MRFLRWIVASAFWIVLPAFGQLAADEEQVRWIKLDEARAKSIQTGKPVLVLCFTDLLPDGPPTKTSRVPASTGSHRAPAKWLCMSSRMVVPRRG